MEDRVVCVQAEVAFAALQVTYAADTVGYKLQQMDSAVGVSVLDFGADPTGVALSNDAFNAAKVVSNTLLLPAGTYRLEGWTAQDVDGHNRAALSSAFGRGAPARRPAVPHVVVAHTEPEIDEED